MDLYYLLCFSLFIVLFYKPIIRYLLGFLDEKITEIKWNVESAIHSKQNIEKELLDLRKDMPFIERAHKEMIETAKKEIDNNYKNRCADLKEILKFKKKNAETRIRQIEKRAISNIKSEILNKAIQIVSAHLTDSKDSDIAIVSSYLKRQ